MKSSVLLSITLILSVSTTSFSQDDLNRYFVYFTEKGGENYPYDINRPTEFLTQKAIDRRDKQNISIDFSDLPVVPQNVAQLREVDVDVFFTSRWLNGALVQMNENLLTTVNGLPFVDSVALIAEFAKLENDQTLPVISTNFQAPPSVEGDSDIQLKMLGADKMHADNYKGQEMLIAILDNGFRGVNEFSPFQHVWENQRVLATKDFVANSKNVFQYGEHGTAVFSIMASNYAEANFIGITPDANYILCVTEEGGSEDRVEEYNWLLGAEFADSLGADVINASLGYNTFDIEEHNYLKSDLDGETSVVSSAASLAAEKGIIVVTSAGNSGRRTAPGNLISHPADAFGALAVGSVNPNFERSEFSSVGPTADGRIKPDVAAFGDGTAVMRGDGEINRGGGTSFASPLIAGFAAGIWQANPDWSSKEVIAAIKNSGHKNENPDSLFGWGVPNYSYAVVGETALNVSDIVNDKVTIYPNPFSGDTLYLLTNGEFKKGVGIKILGPNGSMVFQKEFKKREIKDTLELVLDSSQQGVYFLFLQIGKDQKVVKLINF